MILAVKVTHVTSDSLLMSKNIDRVPACAVHKQEENTEAKKKVSLWQNCFIFTAAWRHMTHQEWFWAPLIVKAHYQSLYDRTGPAQRLPSLRIIGI